MVGTWNRRFFRRQRNVVATPFHLELQLLEGRDVPTTFTVSSIGDGPVTKAGDQPGTLRQAIFDANALPGVDTVDFDTAGLFSTFQTIALTNGQLTITQSLNILGPVVSGTAVNVAISGSNLNRVFDLSSVGAAQMKYLIVQNGQTKDENGAGVRLSSSNLTLTNCTVTLNHATDFMVTGSDGGGIHSYGGSLTLTDTVVSENNAADNGGGIYATSCPVMLNRANDKSPGCWIYNNTANTRGGGIFQAASSLDIYNSVVEANDALVGAGGGLFADSVTVTCANDTITLNLAHSNVVTEGSGEGGGLWLGSSSSTLTNLTITENKAEFLGAGVYHFKGMLTVNDSAFTKNEVGSTNSFSHLGGGLYTHKSVANLTNCTMTLNKAFVGNGGAIYSNETELTISQCRLTGNTVGNGSPPSWGLGGAIYCNGDIANAKPLTISSSTISANTADESGGAIFHRYGSGTLIQDCTFDGNVATTNDGGAFYLHNIPDTKVIGCTLSGNSAGQRGGGILAYGLGDLTLDHTTVSNSTAVSSGGGIYLKAFTTDSEVTIDVCSIDDNKATSGNGGGIVVDDSPLVTIKNSSISQNTSIGGFGGGLYYPNGAKHDDQINIRNCTIAYNKAEQGGGIYLNGLGSTDNELRFYNCTIAANEAVGSSTLGQGGGIYLTGLSNIEVVLLDSSIVADNFASDDGPDVFDDSDGRVRDPFGLIEDLSGFKLATTGTTPNKNGNDPALDTGGLANNGGPTRTIRLLPSSIAIDGGQNSLGLVYDQRGSGFKREVLGKIVSGVPLADIGSYEIQYVKVVSVECFGGTGTNNEDYYAKNHSRVTHLEITFTDAVTLPSTPTDAFVLTQETPVTGTVTLASANIVGGNKVILTFADHTEGKGSLIDGIYKLTIDASKVVSAGNVPIDGDGNDTAGGNFVSPTGSGTPPNIVYRLFGDGYLTGDRAVTAADFNGFRLVYGDNNAIFDFDGDGTITATDYNAFRLRYGTSL